MRVQAKSLLRIAIGVLVVVSSVNCSDSDATGESAVRTGGPIFNAYEISHGPGVDCSTYAFRYPQPERASDRQIQLLIEIDRIEGMVKAPLSVILPTGVISLESILKKVGIASRVVWSDQLPGALFSGDDCLSDEYLNAVMRQFKNVAPLHSEWSIYLVLIEQKQRDFEFSCVIDPTIRSGAVVMLPADPEHPGAILHAIGHEIGHLLNLPHPWDYYGNTRSLMSYPWRWNAWDWNDPSVYFFDDAGRHHILRGPESCVRPSTHDAHCDFMSMPENGHVFGAIMATD